MKFFLSILCINVFICFSVYAKKEKSVGRAVSYQDSDFFNAQNQDTLTYINPEDDILGRSLVDRNDISDDYQMHVIYVLAKNSEDKQFDVNGKIEEVILKSQEDLQVISACCSEAKIKISDIKYLSNNKIFLMSLSRLNKEKENYKKLINSIVKFEFIESTKSKNINQNNPNLILELIAINLFKTGENYEITLLFQNNAFITLFTEVLEVTLEDQNKIND